MNLGSIIILGIIGTIVTAPSLWLAGRWLVGPEKAKFMDAVGIAFAGTIINAIIGSAVGGGLGELSQLVVFLYLVKTYFDTDYVKAVIISIVATAILIFVIFLLGFIGLSFVRF